MNILITGNGYIAKSLCTSLRPMYNITNVTRAEIDLEQSELVTEWFYGKYFDVVIHTAIRGVDKLSANDASVLDANLRMYYNLLQNRHRYGKFINIGSGAELYDADSPYGMSKRVIQHSLRDKQNFYNLRVYGVFDENEMPTRFIKANIMRYIDGVDMQITQDKMMDFFYMKDFISVMQYYIDNNNAPAEFECNYNTSFYLSEIAHKINNLSDHTVPINLLNTTFANNYVGTNSAIDIEFLGLDVGIRTVYEKLSCKK